MPKKKNPILHVRSKCPVACTLDLVGDKWTLVVVRDLLLGKTRYGEFLESTEGIPTNILAERLKRLVDAGIAKKHVYQTNPTRYEYQLSDRGRDLGPIVVELVRWGERHIRTAKASPAFDRSLLGKRRNKSTK